MNTRLLRRLAMELILALVLGLVATAGLVRVLENRFIYFPPRYPHGFLPLENHRAGVEEVWLTTEDGVKLNAWFLPNPASSKTLLWFHGNAENIGSGLEQLKVFARLGLNVLAVDYRGYGKSKGSPDELGIYRDAEAAYRYLLEAKRFPPENIYLYGHSLGGAVAIDLASQHACGGLIVQSSFTSGREMARRMFRIPLFEYIPKSRFDSIGKIARVRVPVLIVHGTHDEVIPFSMGQRLFQAAPEPKFFLPVTGAGHNDVFLLGGAAYLEHLKKFIGLTSASAAAGVAADKAKSM